MKDKVRTWVKKVYGPYTRKDGRKHVSLYDGKKCKTVSYPKWIMEQHLGRELGIDETVDHIDRDFTNDSLDNLQILSRPLHSSKDALRVKRIEITCIWCGEKALKKPNHLNHNAKQGKAGPFCSKKCSGCYGAEVQNNRQKKLKVQPEVSIDEREYYLKDK